MNNFIIGDLISRINVGSKGHLKSIKVLNNKISLNIINLLYKNGLIIGYKFEFDFILVLLKYFKNKPIISKIKLVSTPGKKVYWSLNKLGYMQSHLNELYVISTSKGILTNNDCILGKKVCGKILLKICV